MADMLGREVLVQALVGSNNYNLATPERVLSGRTILASDKDYKVFVMPTFEELYKQKMFAENIIGVDADYDLHDIRKLPDLFWKANLNYLEPLISKELVLESSKELKELYDLRYEIFNMNLPKLFDALGGTFKQKMKLLPKGTEGTQVLVDLFGYDTKQAQHAYRLLDFAIKYEALGFKNPEKALRYEGEEIFFMHDFKFGFWTQENFERLAYHIHDAQFVHLKEKYRSHKPNEELKLHIENLIMQLVKKKLVA
ncbi:nucleotidyltransferase domain-containing protein [Bacillus phage vB_BanS-Thrax3]|nr:nucleotidyltransferase domain-containing protein [Bacillus phage vB_BanS-Thrax3]